MKILKPFLLFLLLIGCKNENVAPPTDDPQELNITQIDDTNKIEVVTWNIENFPKSDHADEYLIQFIEGLYADIYLLQEIKNGNKLAEVVGNIDDYNYFLLSNSTGQKLAIIYKDGIVSLINTEAILSDDDHYFASKPPLLASIDWTQGDITKELYLLNVHYKCCGDDSIAVGDEDDPEYRRLNASQLLHEYISDNLSDENVIAAGDWNDAIQEPQTTNVFQPFLNDITNFQFVDMSIAQGNSNEWSWQGWNSSYPAIHFDHILINSNLFDEYQNNSVVEVIKVDEYFEDRSNDYDAYLSDHRPVYFQFTP